MLAIHGRTRACMFEGEADYDTIAEVKARVAIPVIANGDIATPERAKAVLRRTGADGVMIGRAAQGRPWLFREITHYLATGERLAPPAPRAMAAGPGGHPDRAYELFGGPPGTRREGGAWGKRVD